MAEHGSASSSSFAPLRQTVFAVLWVATIVGNIGSFVRDVASAWIMTDLSSSPTAVAMVQAAATLPVFLLAIPAGVLSDILDRRKFLIAIQILLACVSTSLLLLSASGMQSVTSLIMLTFLGGVGAALMAPTWQSIVPELVGKKDLRNAVALNSLGINISRAIGPALGGLVLASAGASVAYGVDVISYVFVGVALLWWKRLPSANDALSEEFMGAFRAGLRYAKASKELHVVLIRAFFFFAFTSAVWALLPLVARKLLAGDAGFYGILLSAVGLGAIIGAMVMPKLRVYGSADALLLVAAVAAALVMGVLALAPPQWIAVVSLLVLGMAWIMALTIMNGAAQAILPNWVRGRSLAVYLTVFNGAMTIGSLSWGGVAQLLGIQPTLVVGALGVVIVGLLFHRLKLPKGELDLMPSHHWPEPMISEPLPHDRGPVMVLIEYNIDKAERQEFLKTLHKLSNERRRDGAYEWGVTEDTAMPGIIVEWFLVESWAEHLRQHQRVSNADADIQQTLLRFHQGEQPPQVRHLLAIE